MYRAGEQIKEIISEMQCRIITMDKNKMFRDDWTTGQHILHWLECLEEQMKIQKDDKATGAEILAGMPREERELFLIGCTCPDLFGLQNFGDGRCGEDICGECKLKSLNAVYTYRNGKWEGNE